MPYHHIENAMSRRRERVAPFLTAENAAGILLCAGPVYLITARMDGLLLRIGLLLLAAALGYRLTQDVDGLPLYERIVCHLRGRTRQLFKGRMVEPHEFSVVVVRTEELILDEDGPVQIVPRTSPLVGEDTPGHPGTRPMHPDEAARPVHAFDL